MLSIKGENTTYSLPGIKIKAILLNASLVGYGIFYLDLKSAEYFI